MKLKAQNLTEFAICLAVASTAILGIQIYVKRGLMARHRGVVDSLFARLIKEGFIDKTQYSRHDPYWQRDPYYRESEITEERGTEDKPNIATKAGNVTTVKNSVSREGWQKAGSTLDADKHHSVDIDDDNIE